MTKKDAKSYKRTYNFGGVKVKTAQVKTEQTKKQENEQENI